MHAPPRYQPGELVPGTSLRVVRHLGDGGMGSVFEVIETSVDAPFVMKIVHPHLVLANRGTVAQRMAQEARIMARLNHRNIVRVYRAGLTAEDPPLPFYVADRLTGYTVRQFLSWHQRKGIAVPISWAFWIGASLFAALEHAHAEGAIHRDVKPENLFVHQPAQERPAIKLLDFGVVAVLSDLAQGERLTHGGFAGTPTHAAPEQLRGAAAAPSMDLYAAGVVLFELLAGVHPFPNCRSFDTLAQAHLYETPAPLRHYRRQFIQILSRSSTSFSQKTPLPGRRMQTRRWSRYAQSRPSGSNTEPFRAPHPVSSSMSIWPTPWCVTWNATWASRSKVGITAPERVVRRRRTKARLSQELHSGEEWARPAAARIQRS